MRFQKVKKLLVSALSMVMILTSLPAACMTSVQAAEKVSLKSVEAAEAEGNVVSITFSDGIQAKLTILEDGIFRYNVDPRAEFDEYADVYRGYPDGAKIQQYPDSSDNYTKPEAEVTEKDGKFVITNKAGNTKIIFDKATAKMSVYAGKKAVLTEKAALQISEEATVQTLTETKNENFFGGGTQNGRFVHTGEIINIENESVWTDGGVASPNPFYYSTNGYGVLRNTYMDGTYDFGASKEGVVTAAHREEEFDAYYFISDEADSAKRAQEILQGYFHVTGNPVLLPEYAFYLGHFNAYNRDAWSYEAEIPKEGEPEKKVPFGKKWIVKDSTLYDSEGTSAYEAGGTDYVLKEGQNAESLNGSAPTVSAENVPSGVKYPAEFSARAVLDRYADNDMPFGFFIPNDGYGAGYGQNGYRMTGGVGEDGKSSPERLAAVAANVENLKAFADYAKEKGVATGLWTQSSLTPDANADTPWHMLRDFEAEVKAGVTTLKTDVAWVGYGYSFQLAGVKQAYDMVTTAEYDDGRKNTRPNIISLDGWAGSQRYNSVWTGDQTGGNWEYVRFHIPTFIGQSLSGNPNIGSNMDGIWGGDPVVAARDYQWKSFAPQMFDMDGWGSYVKAPYVHGDPFTGVSRMYLKLKAMMMPYIYTNAYAAANIDTGNGDQGLPMVRALFLEFPEDEAAYGGNAKYEYLWGKNLLVAPLYEDNGADELGNDVRNGIYLPGGKEQIWIDYFTGEQYRGGQILNNFDAPLWKLPLFVRNGAIIPMYAEHNYADPAVEKGVDKTKRIVEFWPDGSTQFSAVEDDGKLIENAADRSDKEYGTMENISYGEHAETLYKSEVQGTAATLTAEKSTGGYEGYEQNKDTTFIVHVSEAPASLTASNGETALSEVRAGSKEAFDQAQAADGTFVSFYDAAPGIETFASPEELKLAEMVQDVRSTGKLYVKFARTDVQANEQKLVIEGFKNEGALSEDKLNEGLAAPVLKENEEAKTDESLTVVWDAVQNAERYELEVDGSAVPVTVVGGAAAYVQSGLEFKSEHSYRIRSVNKNGYSAWSEVLRTSTKDDSFQNTIQPVNVEWSGQIWENHKAELAFDKIVQSGNGGFHSNSGGVGEKLTADYGKVYLFDKIEYYPPADGASGTAVQMIVETSVDGKNWIRHGNTVDAEGNSYYEWNIFNEDGSVSKELAGAVKTIDFGDPQVGTSAVSARYIRFIKADTKLGVWFAANELKPYVVETDGN